MSLSQGLCHYVARPVSQGLCHCVDALHHKHNFTVLQGLCRWVINAMSLSQGLCHSVAGPVFWYRKACVTVAGSVSMACVTGPMSLKACFLSTPIVCRQTF